MKKVWITKDQLIPKPFYKRKLFILFVIVLSFGIVFIIYQVKFISQLSDSDMLITEHQRHVERISLAEVHPQLPPLTKRVVKGIRIRDLDMYQQKYPNQLFKCLYDSNKEINFEFVNDNFCDCPDGTDETFTNACSNGKFYCTKQSRHQTGNLK